MPEDVGYPNETTQERKQRIKKLKARTSKMRLAEVKEKYQYENTAEKLKDMIRRKRAGR